MSIKIENSYRSNDPTVEQRAHFIPCHIDEDGAANVQKYFEPFVSKDQNGEMTASLRGRPLNGTTLPLPVGHRAVLLTETRQPLAEHAERKFQVSCGLKELVYWNYDKLPSKNDAFVKSLDWIDIAEAMHGE